MPSKLSKDDVRMWQERIRISTLWRSSREKAWKRAINYLQSKFFDYTPSDDEVAVNLVHPHVRVIIPAIYSRNPDVLIKASRQELDGMARALQVLVKHYLGELEVKKEVKLCILDALLCGHAWVKTWYETEFEGSNEPDTLIEKAGKLLGLIKPSMSEEEKEAAERFSVAPDERIVFESPQVRRVSPFNIVVPSLQQRPEDMAWISEKSRISILDAKANPQFINTKNLKPSASVYDYLRECDPAFAEIEGRGEGDDEELEFIIAHEIYDARTNTIFTIAEDNELPLEQPKENVYADILDSRHTFIQLRFNEIIDEFYPMSDIQPAEAQFHELNKTRTQMIRHRKRYNRKYVYKGLSEDAIAAIRSGEDGVMADAGESDGSLQDSIYPIIDAPLPPEVYQVEKRIKDDIIDILGTRDYEAINSADSATQAAIIDSAAKSRISERQDIISTFANRIARNIAQLAQKFMSQEQVADIIGQEMAAQWQGTDDRVIKGEFYYEIIPGSTIPVSKEVERQQFQGLYAQFNGDPLIDQLKLRIEAIRLYGSDNPEEWLTPEAKTLVQLMRMRAAEALGTPAILGPDGKPVSGVGGTPGSGTSASTGVPSTGSIMSGQQRNGQPHVPRPGGTGGKLLVPR